MSNYPLGCIIPCTQNILLFSMKEDIAIAKFVMNIVRNKIMVLPTHCNLNLHIICVSLPLTMESEVNHHPLIHIWKLDKFTWDLCGKEGSNVVCYLCAPCNFWTPKICASCLRKVKAIHHQHPLYLIHSFEVHQFDSWFFKSKFKK